MQTILGSLKKSKQINHMYGNLVWNMKINIITLPAFPAIALASALDALVAIAEEPVLEVWPLARTSSLEGDRPLSGLPVSRFRPLLRDDI